MIHERHTHTITCDRCHVTCTNEGPYRDICFPSNWTNRIRDDGRDFHLCATCSSTLKAALDAFYANVDHLIRSNP